MEVTITARKNDRGKYVGQIVVIGGSLIDYGCESDIERNNRQDAIADASILAGLYGIEDARTIKIEREPAVTTPPF